MKTTILTILACLLTTFVMASEDSITEQILGVNMTWKMFAVYYAFGLFGFISSTILDIYSSGESVKNLSINYWWDDNWRRILVSVVFIAVGIMFSEQLLQIPMSPWAGFLAGFSIDKIIENMKQRRRNKANKRDTLK